MAKSLQQLRKDAGFKTAREFADTCGFTASKLARYEKDPGNVPVKSAWRMADVLGCSIDDVVGRDSQFTADLRGEVQSRYDALPPTLRTMLSDYLGYLESKADEMHGVWRRELEEGFMQMLKLHLLAYMEGMDRDAKADFFTSGSSAGNREGFREYLAGRMAEQPSALVSGEEVIEGVMHAYDRFFEQDPPGHGQRP